MTVNRPLLISDCDEVLLHMISHFRDWLSSEHYVDFVPHPEEFYGSMRRRNGQVMELTEAHALLEGFFETEMHRQTLVPHSIETLARVSTVADIVILTNLGDHHRDRRISQLDKFGIRHEVFCNQGGKGLPVARLIKERRPSSTVFVDDLPNHHESVAQHAPQVWRLHMIADPAMAHLIPPAPDAHKRIDRWDEAADWIMDKLTGGLPAVSIAS